MPTSDCYASQPLGQTILFVSHTGQWGGGAEVVLEQMMVAAKDEGYDVQLASPPGELVRRLSSRCSDVHVVPVVPLRRTRDPHTVASLLLGWIKGAAGIARIIRVTRPVVVHANSGTAALAAALPSVASRRPLVWHQHDIVPRRLVNRLVLTPASLMCARVVACSQAVRDSLLMLGIRGNRVLVMHNRVRDSFFEPLVPRDQALRHLALPAAIPIVAMAGRLVPYKAHMTFLEALSLLRADGVDVLGVIAGDKPSLGQHDVDPFPTYERELRSRASRADLNGRVLFLGHCSDVRLLYASADIFVQPSINEPFPLVVLEALASGIPVIASASGGHVEAIRDGRTGILTAPGDAAALASAIQRLLSDEALRRTLAAEGQSYARAHFSASGLAGQLSCLYSSVARTARPHEAHATKVER